MSRIITTTLEKICRPEKGEIISGPFGSNISSKYFVEEGIPVIRGNNLSLSLEKFYDDGFVFVTQEKADELNCYAKKMDLIFTSAGTIGQVGLIPNTARFDKYVISNKQIRARIDTNKVDILYAYYWFASPWIQKLLALSNKGSTVPLLTLWEIKTLPISYPESIEEQHNIALVLETITNKIENNNKINRELESMAKTVYDYWFLQFEFPNEEGKPYKSSGGKMVWNEELKREIPEGWIVESVFKCANTTYGFPLTTNSFSSEGTIPVIRIRDISDNTISAYTTETVDEQYMSKCKDLLVGMDGNFHMNFWARDNDCINQRIFRIRDNNNNNVSVLQIYFEIKPFIKAKEENVARSTVGHLSDKDLKALRILVSNNKSIYQTFDNIVQKIINNKQENQQLISLRDFLLPLLMNGQVGFRD